MLSSYSPRRIARAFAFLLSVFCIVRGEKRFLLFTPLSPAALKQCVLNLGVCFIKLAQVLATRADYFSENYLAELRSIHDEVAAMPKADFDVVFTRAFGPAPPFARFDPVPLASASIGQVHRAELPDGTQVAVKVRRLHIETIVRDDVRIVRFILSLFQPLFSRHTKNSLEAVLSEFSAMIQKEADMAIECDNLRKFRETYPHMGVRFPTPLPEFSGRDALVMSFEEGFRIDDKEALAAAGIAFPEIMERLVAFYVEQMLVRGFFHADPHPGNLLVREDGTLVLLDFGMVKRLAPSTRVAMIELVKAAHEQDYELFIAACKRLGVVASTAPAAQLQELAERMFDILGNEHLSSLNMQKLAFEILNSMKELPFKMPQEVVFVMRASSLIEGLGTTYIDNFNGVKDILPVLRRHIPRAMRSGAGLFPTIKHEVLSLPLTLRRIKSIITDMSDASLKVELAPATLEAIGETLRAFVRPLGQSALCLAGAFFLVVLDQARFEGAAWGLFALGAARLLLALR